MIHLFHILTIITIISELSWIYSPIEKTKSSEEYFKLQNKFKGKQWDDYSEEYKNILWTRISIALITIVWLVLGLATFNWVVFLALIVLNFIIIAPLSQLTKFSNLYMVIHWINSVIGFFAAIFILVNQYQLHIDLYLLLTELIK